MASASSCGTPRTVGVHQPKVELRDGVALLGSSAVPGDGLGIILRHAPTLGVHRPESELRVGVALLGSSAVPGDGLGIILRHAPTLGVHQPEPVQRRGRGRERPPPKKTTLPRLAEGGLLTPVLAPVLNPHPRLGWVAPVLIYPWREGPETTAGAGAPGAAVVRTTIQNGPTAGRFAVDFRPGPKWNRNRSPAAQVERPPVPFQRVSLPAVTAL